MDLSEISVIDGHCHPLLRDPWVVAPETFLDLFTEGRPRTMTAHIPHTAYFRRALHDLARRLGAEATVGSVLEHRQALGPATAREALTQSQVEALLVDTGYPPGAMPLAEMRSLLPSSIHEVFRVETCAESLLMKALPWEDFVEALRDALRAAAQRCVAFKTIVAYRSGLAIQRWEETASVAAYRRAVTGFSTGGSYRLTDKPLLDALFHLTLELARETNRPLQVHAGFGDPDIDLLQANPLLLRPILEDPQWTTVRIVVLHLAYPYFREAAFMTAVWPQVYLDLSLALPLLGAGAVAPLIETLSLAPASKLLYGSDLGGLPELFALSADWARAALGEALGALSHRERLTEREGVKIARAILSENARALYRLSET